MDYTCAFSAFLFFVSNLLGLLSFFLHSNRSHFDWSLWRELDPDYLKEEWDFRLEHRYLFLSAMFVNALAWIVFLIPIVKLSWILSRGGKRKLGLHASMVAFALGGSIAELVTSLFLAGISSAGGWVVQEFNLDSWTNSTSQDGIGWRSLEIAYITVEGMTLWINAFEWLALFGILTLTFVSVRSLPDEIDVFGTKWPWLGLVIGLLSLVSFIADLLRLRSWGTFATVAAVIALLNVMIILPIWLLVMGRTMPLVTPKYDETEDTFVNNTSVEQAQVS